MKYLVTGGAGFIGSNLVDSLISMGHEVIVIDNSCNKEKKYWNKKAKNYNYNINDYKNTKNLYIGVDCVFHMAAECRIQNTIKNPLKAIETNILGTAVVLQCSLESGVKKVIYSSTSSAYGNNGVPYVETQKENYLNPYSLSKVSGEKICKMYSDLYDIQTVSLRYFNVYGNRQPESKEFGLVLGIFRRQKREGKPLSIIGDGLQKRDFTHVQDVVDANILIANKALDKKYWGDVFNIGSGQNYSIKSIASMISCDTISLEDRPAESKETLANIEKAKNVFGWFPQFNVIDWIKNNE
ncbi:MAG: Prochlorococcus phage [Pseudomonadota bacterium]|jgi:UDP-glucose 4-epimerase